MKKILLLKTLVFFIFISNNINAQKYSGFLGKKTILSYSANYNLKLFDYTPRNPDNPNFINKTLGFINARHELGMELILKRDFSIQPFYSYTFAGADNNANSYGEVIRYYNFNAHEFGIGIRKYRLRKKNTSIAPIGNYFHFRVFANNAKFIELQSKESDNFLFFGGAFGFGKQTTIFKTWILDFGTSFGYVQAINDKVKNSRIMGEDVYGLTDSPTLHLFTNHVLSFRIGIGLPLF